MNNDDYKFVPDNYYSLNHTKQILLCVRGDIIVGFDDSILQKEVLLKQGDWVYMDKLTWGYQKFLSDDNIMVVLASTKHNKDDYITNKQEFYSIIGGMK